MQQMKSASIHHLSGCNVVYLMAFIDDLIQCDLNWEKGENLKKALLLKAVSYSVTNVKWRGKTPNENNPRT